MPTRTTTFNGEMFRLNGKVFSVEFIGSASLIREERWQYAIYEHVEAYYGPDIRFYRKSGFHYRTCAKARAAFETWRAAQ